MEPTSALRDIPVQDIEPLLEYLESDFPNNIHAWSFLKSILRWKKSDSAMCAKILALNGDYRSKFIILYAYKDALSVQASALKWSKREDDDHEIQEALRSYKGFPWLADKKVDITALTEETNRVVAPIAQEFWTDGLYNDWHIAFDDVLYWMPKEEALKFEFEVPEGKYLAYLTVDHAKEVDEHWKFRDNGSLLHIESILRYNFGFGLFDSETQELVSWAVVWSYGGIGGLHTKERHRRKGYGTIILKAVSREIANRNEDVHLFVILSNTVSKSMMEKLNFRVGFKCSWIWN